MSVTELACKVLAWLVSLPLITNGAPIERNFAVATSIANAVASSCIYGDRCDVATRAAILDVWGAFETGYQDIGGACPGVDAGVACDKAHAVTCGPFMTECKRARRTDDLDGEAWLALDMFDESFQACGAKARAEHDEVIAFGLYAGGKCDAFGVVRFRLRWVRKELGQ